MRGKLIAAKVLLLLVTTGLALTLGELVLRRFVDLPLGVRLPQVRYDPHPVRRFTLKGPQQAYTFSSPVTIDGAGFRKTGREPAGGDEPVLFALGDSFTFGLGVADDQTWPARLEGLLNTSGSGPVRVINGGTTSYGVFQEYDLFVERGLGLHPAAVIHALYWNDYMSARAPSPEDPPVLTDDGYFVWDDHSPPNGRLRRGLKWATNNSALLYVMKRTIQSTSGAERGLTEYEEAYRDFVEGDVDERDWAPIAEFYAKLEALAESGGFRVYAVILPVQGLLGDPDAAGHPFARYARGVLERHGIPYVDCIALWQRRGYGAETYLPHNRHLNERGYGIIAEELERLMGKAPATRASSRKEYRLSDSRN